MIILKDILEKKRTFIFLCIKILLFLAVYTAAGFLFVLLAGKSGGTANVYTSGFNIENAPIIIIDAGHGGIDGGAVSESGVVEKEINLKISEKLHDLCVLSGLRCVMTRESDTELTPKKSSSTSRKRSDLIARVEIGNSFENAIFVSIHQNKFPSSKLSGLQVFYSKNNPESRNIAETVRQTNQKLVDSSNKREIKPAGREIFVLDSLEIPAILVECGFLSNATEAKKLSGDEYQTKLAFMLYCSIFEYLDKNFS